MIKSMKMFSLLLLIMLFISNPVAVCAQSSFEDFPTATELMNQLMGDGINDIGGLTSELLQGVTSQTPLTLVSSPTNPKPGETITITMSDYGQSTSSANIDWYVDNELFSSGIGIKSISFKASDIGIVNTIHANVTRSNGQVQTTAPITVGASYVDILWEAIDAKTLPFYKGKALPSWDTIIKAYVIPEVYSASGVRVPASTFVYTWKKNQRAIDLSAQSGYGKQSAFVLADFARKQHLVSVNLSNETAAVTAGNTVAVKLYDPQILLYEKRPLDGIIFERSLSGEIAQPRANSALRIVAYPFGLDSRSGANVSFKWWLNGRSLTNSGTMYTGEIPLISNNTQRGTSTVSLEVTNWEKPLQSAKGSIKIDVE